MFTWVWLYLQKAIGYSWFARATEEMKQMRLALSLLLVVWSASVACTTPRSSTDPKGSANATVVSPEPVSTSGDTYWIVSVTLLNGGVEYSDVLQLPTDDTESVAAAVNAWGRGHGRMTNEKSIYPFTNSTDAQKWRSAKGSILRLDDLTRDDLIPRLCVGQQTATATDYWVIAVNNDIDRKYYVSSPLLLPEHSDKAISSAVSNWITGTGGRGLSVDDANTRKFANLGEAESFVSKSGMEHLDLTVQTLNKYLCANQPDESQPTPRPRPEH